MTAPATLSSATPWTAITGPLNGLGVIRAQGEEAAKFLHGQLTQDMSLLGLSEARLAGYCSPKGRLLASFIAFKRSHDDVLLVCSRDLLAPTLKRLSMFVLRARVQLQDASAAFQVRGLVGTDPAPPVSHKLDGADGSHTVTLYPAAGLGRALWIAPCDVVAPALPALDAARWDWLEVMSGVTRVTQPVVDAFVPQMINFESVGGVNFKKGCYPGQEVVARSQFRGTLKRRAYLVRADASLSVGQDVFHSGDDGQPCGTVALAAANPEGGWNALVAIQVAAAGQGRLHAGTPSGPLLALQPLPYTLLDDV
ncbi:MAG: YgfZ/GcvT domain-containing protein [Hydrogenophaga sp.]